MIRQQGSECLVESNLKPRQPVAFLLLAVLPRAPASGGGGVESLSDVRACI